VKRLSSSLAISDPEWVSGFFPWLRGPEANIRTASLMGAASAVHARIHHSASVKADAASAERGINRSLVDSVCQRADEPTELAAMFLSKYGELPKPAKRGLGDAAQRLWNSYSVQKYDTASHGLRFADLMNLAHFTLEDSSLAAHIINRRYGNPETFNVPEMIQYNQIIRKEVANGNYDVLLNSEKLRAAGMTWEDALSLAGNHVDKGKLWSALIMAGMVPIFATLRNLRNFDEAGISQQASDFVHAQLTNPDIISKSRILPFRFLSALEALDNFKWKGDLETAVQIATKNVPVLDGPSIVLVDTSGSMSAGVSNRSKMSRCGIASFFGGAFAAHNADNVRLYVFADNCERVPVKTGQSVLGLAEKVHRSSGSVGHGTRTGMALRKAVGENPGAKRAFIFTDMQSFPHGSRSQIHDYGYSSSPGIGSEVPSSMHLYSVDVAGYKVTDLKTGSDGRTHQLAGMAGDPMYRWVQAVERGANADWPWK
jgi:hypothetical protein